MDRLDTLVTAMFLMEGLDDFVHAVDAGQNLQKASEDLGMGRLELVEKLAEWEAPLTAAWAEETPHAGVFHYEVTSAFGWWFAGYVTDMRDLPSREEAEEKIAALVKDFRKD
jgi:hypothetical protein